MRALTPGSAAGESNKSECEAFAILKSPVSCNPPLERNDDGADAEDAGQCAAPLHRQSRAWAGGPGRRPATARRRGGIASRNTQRFLRDLGAAAGVGRHVDAFQATIGPGHKRPISNDGVLIGARTLYSQPKVYRACALTPELSCGRVK